MNEDEDEEGGYITIQNDIVADHRKKKHNRMCEDIQNSRYDVLEKLERSRFSHLLP